MVPISTALFNHEIKAVVVTCGKRSETKDVFCLLLKQPVGRQGYRVLRLFHNEFVYTLPNFHISAAC